MTTFDSGTAPDAVPRSSLGLVEFAVGFHDLVDTADQLSLFAEQPA